MLSELKDRLAAYDGKLVDPLTQTRGACGEMPGYRTALVTLCSDPQSTVAEGASWLLKADLEDGVRLDAEQTEALSQLLAEVPPWQAQLHLCQMIDKLDLTGTQAERFMLWATGLEQAGRRPLLRAWRAHLMVVIGATFAAHRAVAEDVLNAAEQDKAASVRARAKHLRTMLDGAG